MLRTDFALPEADLKDSGLPAKPPLVDPFGRAIRYLRVSVTDRCDFRCVYCMAEDMTFLPKRDLLTLEELDRLCSAFICRGTKKLRLTGGEPLMRRDVMTLFRQLSRHLRSGALEERPTARSSPNMRRSWSIAVFAASTSPSTRWMPQNSVS